MFTGIISDLGAVREIVAAAAGDDARFVFETGYDTAGIDIGASIACSGACLTVVDKGPGDGGGRDRGSGSGSGRGWFAADVSAETLARTTLGDWSPGDRVNFERPLRLGDELGGHMLTGHVDATAAIVSREAEGGSLRFVIEAPAELAGYIAAKGSVALDGVSLTVNETDGRRFGVNVIPHTQAATTFGIRGTGERMNLEVDVLARYVARQLGKD